MAEATIDKSMTRREVDRIKAPFELDLIAFFKALEEEVFNKMEDGIKDNKTPDEIIMEIEELFNE